MAVINIRPGGARSRYSHPAQGVYSVKLRDDPDIEPVRERVKEAGDFPLLSRGPGLPAD
jgi:hypothetical protein